MNVQNGGFWMLVSCLVVLLGFEPISNTTIFAEEVGLTGLRDGNRWTIPLAPVGPTRIPRVFASIRSATFQNMPNAAIVVEVPLEGTSEVPLTLTGKLTTELDQIIRVFKVSAAIDPQTVK